MYRLPFFVSSFLNSFFLSILSAVSVHLIFNSSFSTDTPFGEKFRKRQLG